MLIISLHLISTCQRIFHLNHQRYFFNEFSIKHSLVLLQVKFVTPVYHPAVKDDGSICKKYRSKVDWSMRKFSCVLGLDLLGEKWTPNLSIVTSRIEDLLWKDEHLFLFLL